MQHGAGFDPFASLGNAVLTPTPIGAATSSKPVLKAKVNFDYTAQAANQISLKAGWVIEVVVQGEPGGWSKGKDLQGSKRRLILCFVRYLSISVNHS